MTKKEATRDAYGRALLDLGASRPDVVVLDADLSKSTMTTHFAGRYPERFFNIGIAEQDLISTACGLALTGLKPFASTFAIFAVGRAFEQVRNDAAYADIPIVIAATHAGLTVGADGGSHQAIEDLAITRVLPNLQVWVPADGIEAYAMIMAAADAKGPVYVRMGRQSLPHVMPEDYVFTPGKAHVFPGSGGDVTIIACGVMVVEALQAAETLNDAGISTRVINMGSIKPFDVEALHLASQSRLVVTAEEHLLAGGLGSLVAEQMFRHGLTTRLLTIGIDDVFGQSGEADELLDHYGLRAANIVQRVTAALS